MRQSHGETLYRMYRAILDRSGVEEADKWRTKLNQGQKIQLRHFEKRNVDESGEIVDQWAEGVGGLT